MNQRILSEARQPPARNAYISYHACWLILAVSAVFLFTPLQSFAQALSAPNLTISTPQNTPVQIDLTTFNPDASALGVDSISPAPAHGTATTVEGGPVITYTPTPGFIGTDRFTYEVVCDCELGPATGTVTVIVDATSVDSSIYGVIGALQQSTMLLAFAQIDNFDRHLEDLREVLRKKDALGITINGQSSPASSFRIASLSSLFLPVPHKLANNRGQSISQTAQSDASAAVPIELPDRIGIFINGNLSLRQITGSAGRPDASPRTASISGGVDYRLNAGTIIGIGAGYTSNSTDIGGGSKSVANALSLTAYGTTRPLDPVYIDAQLSYNHITFNTTRDVAGAFLYGKPDGNTFSGSLTGGYEFDSGPYTFGPYVRLDGAHAVIDPFTEAGPIAFAITSSSQTVDSAHAVLGFRGDRAISTSYGILSPHVRGEYLHEFMGASSANVGFASGAASGFVVGGYPTSHNYLMLGGGASFLTVSALSVFVDYDALVGYTNQTSH